MTLLDGPHGIRKQEGAGDQLVLNGSVPATCFPTAATIANSWDPDLGEEIGRYLGEEADPKSIMSSYNMINGVYANENEHLLQEILRDQWGFSGFVVSDWGASNDHVLGVAAGSHLEMPSTGGDSDEELIQAVKDGKSNCFLCDNYSSVALVFRPFL